VGLWSVGYFSPDLVRDVMGKALAAQHVPAAQIPGRLAMWVGMALIAQNCGSFWAC